MYSFSTATKNWSQLSPWPKGKRQLEAVSPTWLQCPRINLSAHFTFFVYCNCLLMPGVCLVMKLLLLMLLTKTAKYKVQSLQSQIGSCHLKASLNFFLALCSRKFGANCFTQSVSHFSLSVCLTVSELICRSWNSPSASAAAEPQVERERIRANIWSD